MSMAGVVSYRNGDSHRMTNVPSSETTLKSSSSTRSSTVAMNAQSWSSCSGRRGQKESESRTCGGGVRS